MYYFSFDVESVGLFGPPFAVGWVVVDELNAEYEAGLLVLPMPQVDQVAEDWLRKNVLPHLPQPHFNNGYLEDFPVLARRFWQAWTDAKRTYPGITMVTDCPFPVEANFLMKIARELELPMEASPYPVLDVASILFGRGFDPVGFYGRLSNELPAHHPVNDARQSVRTMLAALNAGTKVLT